jgi:hypothetical protein
MFLLCDGEMDDECVIISDNKRDNSWQECYWDSWSIERHANRSTPATDGDVLLLDPSPLLTEPIHRE